MPCVYRKNTVQLLTANSVSYFCIKRSQLQVKSRLTVSSRKANRKKFTYLWKLILEKPDSVLDYACVCSWPFKGNKLISELEFMMK